MDCLCQTKLLLPCSAASSLWKQASSGETCPAWKRHVLYALPEWDGRASRPGVGTTDTLAALSLCRTALQRAQQSSLHAQGRHLHQAAWQ